MLDFGKAERSEASRSAYLLRWSTNGASSGTSSESLAGIGPGPGGELHGPIDGAFGEGIGVASGHETREHGSGETLLERGDRVDRSFV